MDWKALRWTIVLLGLGMVFLAFTTSPPPTSGHGRLWFGLWRTRNLGVGLGLLWLAVFLPLALHSRPAFVRILLAHLGLLLAWIAAEAAGLIGMVSWSGVLGSDVTPQPGTRAVPHLTVRGDGYEDLARGWGYPAEPIPYEFKTDRRGFRNAQDREAADVYLLGDSFLVAGLVPIERTLSSRIEAQIGRPVMNVALVGLSPQEERNLFIASELPVEGRLVLHFIFEGNDYLDSARFRSEGQVAPQEESLLERTLANALVVKLQRLTQPHPAYAHRRVGRIDGREYLFGWLRSGFEGHEDELDSIAACLADLEERVTAAGGRYAVVVIPSKIRVLGPFCEWPEETDLGDWERHCGPLPDFLQSWAEQHDVPLFDLTRALSEATRSGEVPWFPGDTHWNEVGHRVAAEALSRWDPVQASEATR